MPIQELNPQEFAKNLAQQAGSYVPEDISEENKQYITKKVYEFCYITGDHLQKQHNEQFSDQDAVIVIQFIGEWTFHKAIDLIRAGIRYEFWDTILQQVAFAALKAALQAHAENMDQTKAAALIESQVMEAYTQCIHQLVKSKAIKEEDFDTVLSQSNVDKMADESAKEDTNSIQDDEKMLKYIAIALMMKKMPKEKAAKVLANMNKDEKQRISSCLQIEDLEKKVAPSVINKYLKDLKKNLSLITRPSTHELAKLIKSLQEKYGEEDIINLTMYERSKIKDFLSVCMFEDSSNVTKVELSPYIVKILYSYLKNQLAA